MEKKPFTVRFQVAMVNVSTSYPDLVGQFTALLSAVVN